MLHFQPPPNNRLEEKKIPEKTVHRVRWGFRDDKQLLCVLLQADSIMLINLLVQALIHFDFLHFIAIDFSMLFQSPCHIPHVLLADHQSCIFLSIYIFHHFQMGEGFEDYSQLFFTVDLQHFQPILIFAAPFFLQLPHITAVFAGLLHPLVYHKPYLTFVKSLKDYFSCFFNAIGVQRIRRKTNMLGEALEFSSLVIWNHLFSFPIFHPQFLLEFFSIVFNHEDSLQVLFPFIGQGSRNQRKLHHENQGGGLFQNIELTL